jgi:hypothetical protein
MIRRRYISAGTISLTFTQQMGHNQFLVATTSILANSYVESWRIKRIRVWATSDNSAEAFCSIIPFSLDSVDNNFNDRAVKIEDATSSVDRPAFIELIPKPNTPIGAWHITSTVNTTGALFLMTASTNSIIDIDFDTIVNTIAGVTSYTVAIVAGTAGRLYAIAPTTNMVPQGVGTI